jgi:hypothetical protein
MLLERLGCGDVKVKTYSAGCEKCDLLASLPSTFFGIEDLTGLSMVRAVPTNTRAIQLAIFIAFLVRT